MCARRAGSIPLKIWALYIAGEMDKGRLRHMLAIYAPKAHVMELRSAFNLEADPVLDRAIELPLPLLCSLKFASSHWYYEVSANRPLLGGACQSLTALDLDGVSIGQDPRWPKFPSLQDLSLSSLITKSDVGLQYIYDLLRNTPVLQSFVISYINRFERLENTVDARQSSDGPILLPNLRKIHVSGDITSGWGLTQHLPEPACELILGLTDRLHDRSLNLKYREDLFKRVSGFRQNKTGQQVLPNGYLLYDASLHHGSHRTSYVEFGFPSREGSSYVVHFIIDAPHDWVDLYLAHIETLHLRTVVSILLLVRKETKQMSSLRSIIVEAQETADADDDRWFEDIPLSYTTVEDLTFKNCHRSWMDVFERLQDKLTGIRVHWEEGAGSTDSSEPSDVEVSDCSVDSDPLEPTAGYPPPGGGEGSDTDSSADAPEFED
jgi:hypothetical protein